MQGFAIKTSDLDRQFNIGKNTRVNRLAMIGLLPEQLHKDGKFYWLTQEQYDLFCDFDSYIRATGGTKDYPNLYVSYTENSTEFSDKHEDCGELTTVASNNIATGAEENLNTTTFSGEFPGYRAEFTPGDRLAQQIQENAQNRAAALIMAESMLADRYLHNPDALPANLRDQIDSVQFTRIDPKGLAASLVRGVEQLPRAA
jgi:hypothetical protein